MTNYPNGWPDVSAEIEADQESNKPYKWDSQALDKLAEFVRLQSKGAAWDGDAIRTIITDLAGASNADGFDYASAIELGNQIIAESPYSYKLGSVYLKDYQGNEAFRVGGYYAEHSIGKGDPITQKPEKDCVKFRTPKSGQKGDVADIEKRLGDFKSPDEDKLCAYKWNPWLYPHKPEQSIEQTHNVLKTLEYGYKDLPTGEDLTNHSPHLVILYTATNDFHVPAPPIGRTRVRHSPHGVVEDQAGCVSRDRGVDVELEDSTGELWRDRSQVMRDRKRMMWAV